VGVLYFVLALLLAPLLYLLSSNAPPGEKLPGIAFVLGPFIYAVIGYVAAAIGCWLYNLIARWSGGVSLTLEPEGAAADTA
jgi:hypothetical protein